jgi:chemosensory pili system protein ChpA (sensor histidine kinase/response regulator)
LEDQQLLSQLSELAAGITPAKTMTDQAVAEKQKAATARQLASEDGGILSIFLEEASEILERCDTLLNQWRDKLSDQKLVQNLQREIHTFKGGARMAGLDPLGDLSHSMETLLERIAANRLQATVAAVQALEEGCDRLTLWVEQLASGHMPEPGEALSRFERKAEALALLPAGKEQRKHSDIAEPPALQPAIEASETGLARATSQPAADIGHENPALISALVPNCRSVNFTRFPTARQWKEPTTAPRRPISGLQQN